MANDKYDKYAAQGTRHFPFYFVAARIFNSPRVKDILSAGYSITLPREFIKLFRRRRSTGEVNEG